MVNTNKIGASTLKDMERLIELYKKEFGDGWIAAFLATVNVHL